MSHAPEPTPPREPLPALFLRFLRFGLLAWGGPVAQIAMIKAELVDRERWISHDRFTRVLAVYQALPGPEAHELCCYFGMISRGRIGALLAGLGFMLPGFLLVLFFSFIYTAYDRSNSLLVPAFAGAAPIVVALVLRATHRIGAHILRAGPTLAPWLWLIAITTFAAQAAAAWLNLALPPVALLLPLILGGIVYALAARAHTIAAGAVITLAVFAAIAFASTHVPPTIAAAPAQEPTLAHLAGLGLQAGLFTFGGAYTALPYLQHDAVTINQYLTLTQFLDGIAIVGILPTPLIMLGTFVGYSAAGLAGALVITAAIFAPAFAFTLIGHEHFERLVDNPAAHAFLDGIAAAVVGLIAFTALQLTIALYPHAYNAIALTIALVLLYRFKHAAIAPALIIGSAALMMIASALSVRT